MLESPIDSARQWVNLRLMDLDDLYAKTPGDPLTLLVKQDLDPMSVEELTLRIEALEGEIARVNARIQRSVNHRASADAIFKR